MQFITNEQDLKINNLTAIYFYASWMPLNKKMLKMIEKVENKYKNIKFIAVDCDFFKNICKRYEVSSIPTVIILNKEKELKRINGLLMTSAFTSIFNDIIKKEGDKNE